MAVVSLVGGAALLLAPLPWPLAALGALAYVAGAVLWPLGALGGMVLSLPFYLYQRQLVGQAISPTEATLVLGALGIGARTLWDRHRNGTSGGRDRGSDAWQRFDAPLVAFLAAALLSLLATEYLRLSLRELRTLVGEPVLFFILLRATVKSSSDARTLIDALAVAATVVAAIAVVQFFVGGAVTEVQGVRRVHGTYTSPNHLGLLLGRVIPFLVALAWLLPKGRRLRLAAAAVCALALVLTFSLGAWLGTGVALLAVVGLIGGRRPLLALLFAGALAAVAVLSVAPTERLAGRLDPTRGTTLVRVRLWEASLDLIRQQPLLGIGLDNFLYRYADWATVATDIEPNLSHPHNLVLQFWLQLGALGVVALAWLLAELARATVPRLSATTLPPTRALAVGGLASMVDFVVHGAIDNSYFLPDMANIFWLTVATACILSAREPGRLGAETASGRRVNPRDQSGVQSPTAAPT